MSGVLALHSSSMTNKGEKNVVRASEALRERLGLEVGDLVTIKEKKYYVLDANYEDTMKTDKAIFFSSEDFGEIEESTFDLVAAPADKLTIGCDPEFLLKRKDSNALVNASHVLPFNGKVGSDGELGELRPNPSDEVYEVMNNLRELIQSIPFKTPHIPVAQSYHRGYLAGFHVHLGIPKLILRYPEPEFETFVRNVIATLDYFVGIPSTLFEDTDKRRTSNSEYGKAGDFRITECTLEYRFPGGFYLRHPAFTRVLLDTCYTVVEDIIGRAFLETRAWTQMSRFSDYSKFKSVYNLPAKGEIQHILSTSSKYKAQKYTSSIYNSFEKLYNYNKNKKFIDKLFATPKVIDENILANWS